MVDLPWTGLGRRSALQHLAAASSFPSQAFGVPFSRPTRGALAVSASARRPRPARRGTPPPVRRPGGESPAAPRENLNSWNHEFKSSSGLAGPLAGPAAATATGQ